MQLDWGAHAPSRSTSRCRVGACAPGPEPNRSDQQTATAAKIRTDDSQLKSGNRFPLPHRETAFNGSAPLPLHHMHTTESEYIRLNPSNFFELPTPGKPTSI